MSVLSLRADARSLPLRDGSVHCCVTSPPYWGLRDYGHADQIGMEPTPDLYVASLVAVFREVRRVLADDGTLWLNLGDSYARVGGDGAPGATALVGSTKAAVQRRNNTPPDGLKHKDLVGIPWRVAFALQADGWYLRSDIIWHKPNPMPESVTDRPTKAHEYVFLLTKSDRYHYDAAAISEDAVQAGRVRADKVGGNKGDATHHGPGAVFTGSDTRNRRTVWTIPTKPYAGAHFAVMPEALAEPCILAGTPPGGIVLDPFGGSGTVARVAVKHGRRAVLCDLNPEYIALQCARTSGVQIDLLTKRAANLAVRAPKVSAA